MTNDPAVNMLIVRRMFNGRNRRPLSLRPAVYPAKRNNEFMTTYDVMLASRLQPNAQ